MPTCKLPNCPIAKDGRCLEGIGPSCPNLVLDTETLTSESDETRRIEEPQGRTFLPLPRVTPLDVAEARVFSRRGRAVVVAFTGMKDCGKTSLLARLHQMFLSGPIAGLDFAAGRSLPRFEELNWLATMESGVSKPKMPRSSAQFDNSFLHLAVRPTNGGGRVDLLLNDISGETFKRAVAAQTVCEKLLFLARADHLVTLLDGEALADPKQRHTHASFVSDFLERVLQTGQCGKLTAAHLVFSKMDKLKNNDGLTEELEKIIQKKFGGKFGSLAFWRIAARPMDKSMPTVEPIGNMFFQWVRNTHRRPATMMQTVGREVWERDFCKYGS